MSEQKPLREYRGTGIIRSAQGTEVSCEFILSQFPTGRLVLVCNSPDPVAFSLFREDIQNRPLKGRFEGILTDSQAHVTIETIYLDRTTLDLTLNRPSFITFEFIPFSAAEVEYQQIPSGAPVKYRIGLTNLLFLGTEWITRGSRHLLNKLPLNLPSGQIFLDLLKPYNEISSELAQTGGTQVTAELVAEVTIEGRDRIRDLCDNLCILLSFATGTWISWLYEDYFLNGQLAKTSLLSSKTLPYHHADNVIDITSGHELKDYLETSYPTYVQLKDSLGFNIVIEYYIHSKSTRILELEYLIATIGMDCLCSYLSDYFKAKNKKADLGTFRKKLESLYEDISMPYAPNELGFIKIRDKIVHTGRFPSGTNRIDEYQKFINLYDRTILTALGYRGKPYLNITKRYTKEPVP